MSANLRSALVLVVSVAVAVGITTLPSRAADESKALLDRVNKLEKKVAKLEAKLKYVSVVQDPINGLAGPHVIFKGCNVHVRSGSGDSTDGTVDLAARTGILDTEPLGLGNLILGYNELPLSGSTFRGGSHNLIVGPGHNYSSVAGVLFGQENDAYGPLASVTGGFNNLALGYTSSVSGGTQNSAENYYASVSGGQENTAVGGYTSVNGGHDNMAIGAYSSVSGGFSNTASGNSSSVSGGEGNTGSGNYSSVSGGSVRSALGTDDWRAGGLFETD